MREKLIEYVKKKYGIEPEYPWMKYPGYAVLRHENNGKWFGVIMNVSREKIGGAGAERVDIVNLKITDAFLFDALLSRPGYTRGYHMNKMNWITAALDGTAPFDEICGLTDMSYEATASAKKKREMRPPKEWIVPANPEYYDIERIFDGRDEADWKQGAGIKSGDRIFMYVAAPVSAVLYECRVTETDIPFSYADENLTIKSLMRIKLLRRYDPSVFTFEKLRDEYGILSVRGPRSVPHSLSEALKQPDTFIRGPEGGSE